MEKISKLIYIQVLNYANRESLFCKYIQKFKNCKCKIKYFFLYARRIALIKRYREYLYMTYLV